MSRVTSSRLWLAVAAVVGLSGKLLVADEAKPEGVTRAVIDGTGLGWRELTGKDFVMVNGDLELTHIFG